VNGGSLTMTRHYHLDPGYITIPEANDVVKRILKIANQNDKTHYHIILEGAKKGKFGGKKHGKRIYQVLREEIIQYANEFLQEEKLKLFNIEVIKSLDHIMGKENTIIDKNTANRIYTCLKYLKLNEIITDEAYQHGERTLIQRVRFQSFKI
jgi:hypothetical protein